MQEKTPSNKISTVNVIEVMGGAINSIHSFLDTEEGNKEAETLFGEICKENGSSDIDIASFIEDGFCETNKVDIHLVHSINI